MESTAEMTPQERADAIHERLLTEDVESALGEMQDAAIRLGAALSVVYAELERRSERKLARRSIHGMLAALAEQTWGEIIPTEEPA
jgi:uncharacterized protein YbjQ (UPF0145 family)